MYGVHLGSMVAYTHNPIYGIARYLTVPDVNFTCGFFIVVYTNITDLTGKVYTSGALKHVHTRL